MEGHFNRASERANRAEGGLAEARARIKLLEGDLEAAKEWDMHNEDLYTTARGELREFRRFLCERDAEVKSLSRKLIDEKFERSRLQIEIDRARHR